MAYRHAAIVLAIAPLWFQNPAGPSPEEQARMDAQNAALREIVKQAPKLPLQSGALDVTPPSPGLRGTRALPPRGETHGRRSIRAPRQSARASRPIGWRLPSDAAAAGRPNRAVV